MPDGGRVRVSASRGQLGTASCLRLEVADNGPGMKPDVQRRALDPFFTTRPTGTGLGLPIVKRVMDAHGGDLIIDTQPGAGTTIALLFPTPAALGADAPVTPRKPRRSAPHEHEPFKQRPMGTSTVAEQARSTPVLSEAPNTRPGIADKTGD
jgi:hypothetical protein